MTSEYLGTYEVFYETLNSKYSPLKPYVQLFTTVCNTPLFSLFLSLQYPFVDSSLVVGDQVVPSTR